MQIEISNIHPDCDIDKITELLGHVTKSSDAVVHTWSCTCSVPSDKAQLVVQKLNGKNFMGTKLSVRPSGSQPVAHTAPPSTNGKVAGCDSCRGKERELREADRDEIKVLRERAEALQSSLDHALGERDILQRQLELKDLEMHKIKDWKAEQESQLHDWITRKVIESRKDIYQSLLTAVQKQLGSDIERLSTEFDGRLEFAVSRLGNEFSAVTQQMNNVLASANSVHELNVNVQALKQHVDMTAGVLGDRISQLSAATEQLSVPSAASAHAPGEQADSTAGAIDTALP